MNMVRLSLVLWWFFCYVIRKVGCNPAAQEPDSLVDVHLRPDEDDVEMQGSSNGNQNLSTPL